VTLEPREVNGQPGAIFRDRDRKVLFTLTLDVLDGQIQAIRSVSNPGKLRHVGPVADAWAIAREANQARRHTTGQKPAHWYGEIQYRSSAE
jgi:RNA polymerase sigma-70 factor, ECF subfamily